MLHLSKVHFLLLCCYAMNYQSVTSFFPLKKSQFSSRGLGLHNLHAGFNCLAFQSLGATNRRSAFFIPNVLPENEPRKKTLGNSPIFRPEETHQKKHMQHDISKRKHKKMGKHIDLGEGPRQQKTTLSGRDSLLALLNGIFVWSLLNGISEKIIGISLTPKVYRKKMSSKRNVFSLWWFQPIWKIVVKLDHLPK